MSTSVVRKIIIVLCAYICLLNSSVCAFDDPISLLGRIRWNYTSYEENLWTRTYKNTTLDDIYSDHNKFIDTISGLFNESDQFYPIFNESTSYGSLRNAVVVNAFLINPYDVPVLSNVVILNAQVEDYWSKFSNLSSYNVSNVLDVLIDDAIPTLQTALNTFWNTSNALVYFDFLKNVSDFTSAKCAVHSILI